ncbi:MAG TPA: hypothetical protein PLQ48_05920 [Spirochaetota bacterium]|nr:hypothetical protein [Spirochaetota bacterium]
MKKLLFFLLSIIIITSCKYKKTLFLELDDMPKNSNNFKYYHKTLTDVNSIFRLDESFKLSLIGSKDRSNFDSYSKVFYGESEKIVRVENYKRDSFNSHIFYPFLVFEIDENESSIIFNIIRKEWDIEANKIKDISSSIQIVPKLQDISFSDFITKINSGTEVKENIKLMFIAFNNENNRKQQEAIAADLNYIALEGYVKEFEEKKIKMFFFEENRGQTGLEFDKPYPIKASYIKFDENGYINLRFISYFKPEDDNSAGKNMEESVYGSTSK